MPSTYTTNNGIEKPGDGEQANVWDTTANLDFDMIDQALDGFVSVTLSAATATVAITDGALSDGRNRALLFTGSPGANCTVTVTPNDAKKWFFVYNGTSGGFSVIMKQGTGSGTTVTVANGYWAIVRLDGMGTNANVTRLLDSLELITALKAATYTAAAALAIKPGADSTAAVQIQNAAGTQLVVFDTTNGRTAFGPTVPGSVFEINLNTVAVAPETSTDIHIIGSDAGGGTRLMVTGVTNAGTFVGRRCSGTAAAPTAASVGYLAQLQGRGYLTNAWSLALGRVVVIAEETFTNSTAQTGISFEVTPAGSVTVAEKMRLTGAGQLELSSTTGGLRLNRVTTSQRDALTPSLALLVYNTTTNKLNFYNGAAWEAVTSA